MQTEFWNCVRHVHNYRYVNRYLDAVADADTDADNIELSVAKGQFELGTESVGYINRRDEHSATGIPATRSLKDHNNNNIVEEFQLNESRAVQK